MLKRPRRLKGKKKKEKHLKDEGALSRKSIKRRFERRMTVAPNAVGPTS